nr:uncharacterized protein LOC127339268 [Lolium perenne]
MAARAAASAWWPFHACQDAGAESWSPMRAVQREKTWPDPAWDVLTRRVESLASKTWFMAVRRWGSSSVGSVDDTRDARHGMWLTLARLRSARADGQVVLRAAEAAVGHLQAAQFMATRLPPAAGLRAVMEDQVHAAVNKIHPLRGRMLNMCFLVACTVEPAARIHWT